MPVAPIRYFDTQFSMQIPAGTWRWTTRMNTTGSNPSFQIIDISSPYGLLRDSIPLPGDVVTRMAETIAELVESFAPRILLNASALTITLDEGRGFGAAQSVTLTNNGNYGSVLGTSITSSAPYVTATPANVGGLAVNTSGSFAVAADSTNLVAASSPYSATLTVQDPAAVNNPQVITVTVVVRPKARIGVTPEDLPFAVGGPPGGPWPAIPSQTFMVVNNGLLASSLEFQVQKLHGNSPWLTAFSPVSGTLAGGGGLNVTVSVVPPEGYNTGTYEEILRVSGYSSNLYQDVLVTLTIL